MRTAHGKVQPHPQHGTRHKKLNNSSAPLTTQPGSPHTLEPTAACADCRLLPAITHYLLVAH